mmetsp:Transcript_11144/g.18370  ORF Transcript_11144/g.18370 Transcript_11144/m.18370 type:complete len:344 (+) Transcript_11144:139-1170(+)
MSDSDGSNEEYDTFNTEANSGNTNTPFLFDPASIAHVSATAEASVAPSASQRLNRNRFSSNGSRSQATTQLASDVGSTMLQSRIPFLKSVTFFDPKIYYRKEVVPVAAEEEENADVDNNDDHPDVDSDNAPANDDEVTVELNNLQHWDIFLQDPPTNPIATKRSLRQKLNQSKLGAVLKLHKSPHLTITDYEGLFEYSSIQTGDELLSINTHTIDPKLFDAQGARTFMDECIEKEGVLNIVTENPMGEDILLHITIIKPRRDMTYHDLGLIVWNWPYLCVHQINEGSIFEHTPIREMDQIMAINDIDCSKMREREFATVVEGLGMELTITLVRRKHRYTGSFK